MFKCSFIGEVQNASAGISARTFQTSQSTIRHSQIFPWLKTISFSYICHELIFFRLYQQCFLYKYNWLLYIEKLNLL